MLYLPAAPMSWSIDVDQQAKPREGEQGGPEIGIGLALTAYERLTLHEGLVAAFGGA